MNTKQVLNDRFIAVNGAGMKQSAIGTPLLNEDLDTRDKCTVTREEIVTRKEYRDCRDEDLVAAKVDTRAARYTLDYQEVTPQIIARWKALLQGAAIAPVGTPINEVQALARSGSVSSGAFAVSLTLEGRTVTSKPIPWNATESQIRAALTAARMNFIQPGDIAVESGAAQIEQLVVDGTANESEDLAVTVVAAGRPALAGAGKTIQVAIADTDTAAIVAGKIRAALIADADIGHPTTGFFTITGTGVNVFATANAKAANDVTMAISYENAHGMTGATSTNSVAGVAINDWAAGMRITFTGRLANANIPMLVINNDNIGGGGSVEVTSITNGDQNTHEITRSTGREKARVTFALGWDTVADRVEKYADFAVESVTISASLDGNVTLQVSLIGPWEYDSIEEAFDIPECVNIDALQTRDVRLLVNGQWQTGDLNSISLVANDNIPMDRLSAFAFDGMDIQNIERGRQPSYTINMSIFGSETDAIYQIAQNERTQEDIPIEVHFGMPGNRYTWLFPAVELRFENNRMGTAGEAQYGTIQLVGVPFADGLNPPLSGEAKLDQDVAFLLS